MIKIYFKKLIWISVLWTIQMSLVAQEPLKSPMDIQIGKPLPEIVFKNLENYDKKSVSTVELKGKPFVLKFFGRTCSSSIKYLKVTNQLAKEFKGKIHFFVVAGHHDTYLNDNTPELEMKNLRALYNRTQKLNNIILPVTFDFDLFQKVVPKGLPHFILVDKNGIIQAVTNTLNYEILYSLLNEKKLELDDYSMKGKQENIRNINLLSENIHILDDSVSRYPQALRSILMPYTNDLPQMNAGLSQLEDYQYTKKIQGVYSLVDLYNLAHYGSTVYDTRKMLDWIRYPYSFLELKDSLSIMETSYEKPRKNMFFYSLIAPSNMTNPISLKKMIKNDLDSYFGYQISIEKHRLPYWRITLSEKARKKLKSKGGEEEFDSDFYTYFGAKKFPIDKFLHNTLYLHRVYGVDGIPFRNETGNNLNIDVPIQHVDFFNYNEVKKVLEGLGFIIEKAFGDFEVLIIKNPKAS